MSSPSSFWQFMIGGGAAASAPVLPPGEKAMRDLRIDIVRGLALLIIFINHMPGNIVGAHTPANYGFSDAADIFVLLAGVSAVLAYGPAIERDGIGLASLRVGARIWTLYIAHLAVFLIVCGVIAAAVTRTQNPLYIELINIQPMLNDTLTALVGMLTLTYQAAFVDILPLYIVLLAAFPLIYLGARISPLATLALSGFLWQWAGATGLNFPNGAEGHWFFNPFAWQFLFAIGVVAGRAAKAGVTLPRARWLDVAAAAFLAFSVIVKVSIGNPFGFAVLNDFVERLQMGNDKTNLSIVRVVHLLALAWLVLRFVPMSAAWLSSLVGRQLGTVGRHSLEIFCVGTVLSIAGQIAMAETYNAPGFQLLIVAAGITILISLGNFLTWYQSLTRRTVGRSRAQRAPTDTVAAPAELAGSPS